MGLPIVAILGRPNVGKSSLFNRILRKRIAIVEGTPGVTRDRNYGEVDWGGFSFLIVDTGGFIPKTEEEREILVNDQIDHAVRESDLVIFVVDGKEGPQPLDFDLVELVRKKGKSTLLAVNKVDNARGEEVLSEFFTLGLGTPHPISTLQGRGVGDLLDELVSLFRKEGVGRRNSEFRTPHSVLPRIAIVGRPNVGKSSIVNKILGEDRLIVDPVPGTTRDSIDTHFRLNGKEVVLVDTAGLKRKTKMKGTLEGLSTLRTLGSLERCDVALFVLDGTETLTRQDKRIASLIQDRGKGAVLAINKADQIEEEDREWIWFFFQRELDFLASPPIHFTSAVTGEGIENSLLTTIEIYEEAGKEVGPTELAEVLVEARRKHPPPLSGKGLRIKQWRQKGVRPPKFLLYTNQPDLIPPTYLQYLKRKLRERFGFKGIPIEIKPVKM